SADPVTAGSGPGNLSYTVTVANVGMTDATAVALSELLTLPAGVTVVSVTSATGAVVTNSVTDYTWNVGGLAVGGSATLTAVLTVGASPASGTDMVSGPARVTGSGENRVNTSDDTATERTSVVRRADLVLSLDDGVPVRVHPGDTITYTLTYGNAGPSDAGVVLTEFVPAGTTASPSNAA